MKEAANAKVRKGKQSAGGSQRATLRLWRVKLGEGWVPRRTVCVSLSARSTRGQHRASTTRGQHRGCRSLPQPYRCYTPPDTSMRVSPREGSKGENRPNEGLPDGWEESREQGDSEREDGGAMGPWEGGLVSEEEDLHNRYCCIRKTRPDGNCFYRAFGFAHLEALLDNSKELQKFKAIASRSKEDLVTQGFTEFTIEDFHNTFMDVIELVEKQGSLADLLTAFNDQSTSDYLVVYLRLLTSGYLQRESGFFEHFIEGGRTVKEFCQQEVEPMAKESDHIHIIALAQALDTSIRVEYMDRGEGNSTNQHIFPEGSEPRVFLLYRPGHYDILYK